MRLKTAAKVIGFLPKGLSRFISRIVLNSFIKKHASIHLMGEHHLKNVQLPTVFVCNHLSNADGLILSDVLKKIDPTFVAGVKLANNDVTNIGVNVVKTTSIVPNSPDKDGIKKIIDLVKNGESILLFPEGTRSRAGSLISAKKGIVFIARMTKAPIIPIGIYGTEKLLPIDETGNMSAENFRDAEVHINIGQQFMIPKWTRDVSKKTYEENVLDYIMGKIAALLPDDYKGVYK